MRKKFIYFIWFISTVGSAAELECARLTTPLEGSNDSPTSTIIRWTDQLEAIGYEVSIGTSPFVNDILEQKIFTDNFTEELELPPNTIIYVIIIPFSNTQFTVGCEQFTFTTAPECDFFVNPLTEISLCYTKDELSNRIVIDFNKVETELIEQQEDLMITYYDLVGNLIDLTQLSPNASDTRFNILVKVTDFNECSKQTKFDLILQVPMENNNCEEPESMINYQTFFTPNGDGINDLWQFSESLNETLPDKLVLIYDQYGKLLYQLDSNSAGWDGSYKGTVLPSSDYWFVVDIGDRKYLKGHFTLKR